MAKIGRPHGDPKRGDVGKVVHIRLRQTTEQLFEAEAKKMHVPLGSYCRMYIEEMLDTHQQILTVGQRSLKHVDVTATA